MSTPALDEFYQQLQKKKIVIPTGVFIAGFDVYEAVAKGLNISRIEAKKLVLRAQFSQPFKFAHIDNPSLDGTMYAHPAWTRGYAKGDAAGRKCGIELMCRDVNDLIDGIPVPNNFPTRYIRSREETLARVRDLKLKTITDLAKPKMNAYRWFRAVGLPFRFFPGLIAMGWVAGISLFVPEWGDCLEKIWDWIING